MVTRNVSTFFLQQALTYALRIMCGPPTSNTCVSRLTGTYECPLLQYLDSALIWAVMNDKEECVAALSKAGADVDAKNKVLASELRAGGARETNGLDPSHFLLLRLSVPSTMILARPSRTQLLTNTTVPSFGRPPWLSHHRVVQDGSNSLLKAAEWGLVACLKILLAAGADTAAQDNVRFREPRRCNIRSCRLSLGFDLVLLRDYPPLSHRLQEGMGALHWSAAGGRTQCLLVLLSHGLDLNMTTKVRQRPALRHWLRKSLAVVLPLLLTTRAVVADRRNASARRCGGWPWALRGSAPGCRRDCGRKKRGALSFRDASQNNSLAHAESPAGDR